mgnify:CR=1 FL=1
MSKRCKCHPTDYYTPPLFTRVCDKALYAVTLAIAVVIIVVGVPK